MAPPSSNASRPGRALAVLAALIVVLLLAILGSDLASPGSWSKNFRVHLGLDLTSGTTVELRAVKPGGRPPTAADMQQAIQIMENRVNASGTTEAQVQQQGSDIINVSGATLSVPCVCAWVPLGTVTAAGWALKVRYACAGAAGSSVMPSRLRKAM